MARTKQKQKAQKNNAAVVKHDPKNAPIPKDEEELELERLVFGDAEGFRDALKESGRDREDEESLSGEMEEEEIAKDTGAMGDDEVSVPEPIAVTKG